MIRDAYARYLRAGAHPSAAAPLARALFGTPLTATALLLDRYTRDGAGTYSIATGELAGERVYVGARPPVAAPNALWLDVVDLSTSVLVPAYIDLAERAQLTASAIVRAEQNTQWFALQPVPRFVFAGVLDGACDADELGAVTASHGEATQYLHRIGKYFTSAGAWRAARELLSLPAELREDTLRALVPTVWGLAGTQVGARMHPRYVRPDR